MAERQLSREEDEMLRPGMNGAIQSDDQIVVRVRPAPAEEGENGHGIDHVTTTRGTHGETDDNGAHAAANGERHDMHGNGVNGNSNEHTGHVMLQEDEPPRHSRRGSTLSRDLIQAESRHFDLDAITTLRVTGRRELTSIGPEIGLCMSLTELDLSGNALEEVDGIDALKSLKRVVLSNNRLHRLGCLPQCVALEHILLQRNEFRSDPGALVAGLALLPRLRSLYFQNFDGSDANDCCARSEYRAAVLTELPELHILDGERLRGTEVSASMSIIRDVQGAARESEALRLALEEGIPVPSLTFDDAGLNCDMMPAAESEERLRGLIAECRRDAERATSLVRQANSAAKHTGSNTSSTTRSSSITRKHSARSSSSSTAKH